MKEEESEDEVRVEESRERMQLTKVLIDRY
jgi:hypothetical protein